MPWIPENTILGRIVVPDRLPDGVTVFCTTVDFEGMLTSEGVAALRRLLAERFGFRGALSSCAQVHAAMVTSVESAGDWTETPDCDAMIAGSGRTGLVIKVADCLPIALWEPSSGLLANVHSGWRGAVSGVVPATLARIKDRTDAKLRGLRAWLGPCIRACCFEVGDEVVDRLRDSYGEIEPYVDRSRRKPHVDLAGLTTRILIDAGLSPDAIDDAQLCTMCEGSAFHSFRRDGDSAGRNLMVIARN